MTFPHQTQTKHELPEQVYMKGASWLAKTTMARIVPSLQLARTEDYCYTLHLHLHIS